MGRDSRLPVESGWFCPPDLEIFMSTLNFPVDSSGILRKCEDTHLLNDYDWTTKKGEKANEVHPDENAGPP